MTDRLAKWKEVCGDITERPWQVVNYDSDLCGPYNRVCKIPSGGNIYADRRIRIDVRHDLNNSKFICFSANNIDALLARVEKLERVAEEAANLKECSDNCATLNIEDADCNCGYVGTMYALKELDTP